MNHGTHKSPPIHAMAYRGRRSAYCYNVKLGLSSFHIAINEFTFLIHEPLLMDVDWTDDCISVSSTYYFVAYGGHLHLVSLKELKVDKMHECDILKYNLLDGTWKMMDSYEGGALFLGKPSFGVLAEEQTTLITDRVYNFHHRHPRPSFFSTSRQE